nr:hypothetical protein [uncultured Pseudomonas sp.]
MSRINIRSLEDPIVDVLTASAAGNQRSLEAEVRFALIQYAYHLQAPAQPITARQRWQREAGQRLQTLINLLDECQVLGYPDGNSLFRTAEAIGEPSPALLLDCTEGLEPLPYAVAQRLSQHYGCSTNWLMTGTGDPFPVPDIGNKYHEFLEPAMRDPNITVNLIRLTRGRNAGTLLFLVSGPDKQLRVAKSYSSFQLTYDMGATGNGNLKAFGEYLRAHQAVMKLRAFNSDLELVPESIGNHHASFYFQSKHLDKAYWLQQLVDGEDIKTIDYDSPGY